MFDVISAAKNTQWLSFPRSCTKYSYSHVANEAIDFQIVPGKNLFAEFNKKSGFELLRTTNKDGKDIIQRAKKRQFDDLSCGAISKLCGSEIAIGMTTGFIRIFNTQSGDYMPYKFKPDRIGNSVVCLDYSNNDEYLAAVYDSYDINLFGMKTKIKTDTFRFDGLSTFVRFHPARKFALAIGSYEGPITMLDIQTKKKLFFDKSAHEAPVRDISMFESSQDVFASCSYDCNIKVFDLRRRSAVQKFKQEHPMSTLCISPCGTFCVAGNLKGDVISYDFRSMKEPLNTKRVHDSAVIRVAFVPSMDGATNLTNFGINATNWESSTPLHSKSTLSPSASLSVRSTNGMDSFAKFVDVCHHINGAVANEATPKRKDSWADLMPGRKIHDFSTDSMVDTPLIGDFHSELRLKRHSRFSVDQSPLIKITEPMEIEEQTPKISCNRLAEQQYRELQQKLDVMSETDGEVESNCDAGLEADEPKMPLCSSSAANSIGARKRRSTFHESFSVHIKNTNTSSPTTSANSDENSCPNTVMPAPRRINSNDLRSMITRVADDKFNKFRYDMASKWQTATNEFQSNIDRCVDETSNDIQKKLEHFYLLGLQGGENLMSRLTEPFDLLENGLCTLIERDPYALEYFRMKFEIIDLKKKLGMREPSILDHLH